MRQERRQRVGPEEVYGLPDEWRRDGATNGDGSSDDGESSGCGGCDASCDATDGPSDDASGAWGLRLCVAGAAARRRDEKKPSGDEGGGRLNG